MSENSSNKDADRLLNIDKGWVNTTVGQIFDIKGGGTPPTENPAFWDGSIPWMTSADIHGLKNIKPRKKITLEAIEKSATHCVPKGSIIVVTRVGLGKISLAPTDLCFSQDCQALISNWNNLVPEYCLYYLSEAVQIFKYKNQGTTISGVTVKQLRELEFPLPPLSEQHRIVTKIEELFTQMDAGVALLKKVQAQLKRYRQAVLKAAFEGRLTQEWREKHQTDDKHFLEYVEQNWEKYHKGKKFTKIDPSNLLPLPEGWLWSNFDQISQRVTVGHVGPMKEEYIDRGIPFLRSQNVRTNRFDPEGLKFISPGFHTQIKKSTLFPNDIVVVRSGNVGVSCVIPEFLKEANCSDLVIVKQPYGILPSLGAYYMNSTALRLVNAKKVGVALTHFNTKSMAEMVVPLPPIEEQKFLLAEIERLFSIADEIEQTITTSLRQAETLRHSILKRAFEGKLVPQDPNDEPASILLERIKAKKARYAAEIKKGKTLQPKSPKRKIKNAN